MNIPDSLLSSWEGSECSGGLLTFLLEVFPAFLDNRGQGLAFLVHIPLAYHFLNHFSGNGVQDDDGGRPENDIGGLGAYASYYFARFLRNELEGKGTRCPSRGLPGIHHPEDEFFAGGPLKSTLLDMLVRKNVAIHAPGRPRQVDDQGNLPGDGLIAQLVKGGTARFIHGWNGSLLRQGGSGSQHACHGGGAKHGNGKLDHITVTISLPAQKSNFKIPPLPSFAVQGIYIRHAPFQPL